MENIERFLRQDTTMSSDGHKSRWMSEQDHDAIIAYVKMMGWGKKGGDDGPSELRTV